MEREDFIISFPKELDTPSNRRYKAIKYEGKTYINFNYFLDRLLENPTNREDPESMTEYAPTMYWSIRRELRGANREKHRVIRGKSVYHKTLSERSKKQIIW
jgi:hypothetical protein